MQSSPIKTARRIFEILEHFERVRAPQSLKSIAGTFGYPVSSASAILKSMVVFGYIDYDRYSRTYMPTMRLAGLGHWVSYALLGDGGVESFMEDTRQVTGCTVALVTQSDLYAHYVHVLDALNENMIVTRSGTIQPLVRSGIGKLLLSARSNQIISKIVRRANFFEPDLSRRIELSALMEEIREIRAAGYSHGRNAVREGASSFGVLLPLHAHERVLAVGVIGPTEQLDRQKDRIVAHLLTGVAKLRLASSSI